MKPGKMSWVEPESTAPRAGNVYLLRGWIGVFSTGVDNLTKKLNDCGVRANVFQDDQWRSLANAIREKYRGKNHEPLILVGHSYGADDVVRIARRLNDENIRVDLLVTLDPVTPPDVPANVKICINIFRSNGAADALPWLRGIPLEKEKNATSTVLVNSDLKKDRRDLMEEGTDHFNIEKSEKIHVEVIKHVMTVCPPRQTWVAMNHGASPARTQAVVRASVGPSKTAPTRDEFNPIGGN